MTQDQAQPGHNSAAADELRVYIERIERLTRYIPQFQSPTRRKARRQDAA